jgi:hypothetical protein
MVMLRQRLLPQKVRSPRARLAHVVQAVAAGPDALQGEGNGGAAAVGPGVVEAWDAAKFLEKFRVETQNPQELVVKSLDFCVFSVYEVQCSVGNHL